MPTQQDSSRLAHWGHTLAIAIAIVFLVSAVFPSAAGLSHNTASFPAWWGLADVGLAFALGILAFLLLWLAQDKVSKAAADATYKSYRFLVHGILAIILVFFFSGDRIVWINCATGFAWRLWLLLYCLPAWFTALESPG